MAGCYVLRPSGGSAPPSTAGTQPGPTGPTGKLRVRAPAVLALAQPKDGCDRSCPV